MLDELKRSNWKINSMGDLKKRYSSALNRASNLRLKLGVVSWGESLFTASVYNEMPQDILKPKVTEINPGAERFPIFHPSMKDIQKYKDTIQKVSYSELYKKLKQLAGERSYMMINRFGESFLVFPIIGTKDFYIFDSHAREFGVFSFENVIKYIKMVDDSYNFVIWVKGFMTDDVRDDNFVSSFLYTPKKVTR